MIPCGPFRRIPLGGGSLFNPAALPGLELYLDSRLGLSGSHNSIVEPWPDQSGHARDAANYTQSGNSGKMRLQTTSNLSPNGQQTVLFTGADANSAVVGQNVAPNPWPAVTNGYTFYAGFNGLAAASSSLLQLLFNEGGAANFRWVAEGTGSKWEYRDGAGANRVTNTAYGTGWKSERLIIKATGTVDMVIDGVTATWQGGWNQQWNITPGALSGYMIGNLSTNLVVGLHALLGWFLWYSNEHSPTLQSVVDNYLRTRFGMAPV